MFGIKGRSNPTIGKMLMIVAPILMIIGIGGKLAIRSETRYLSPKVKMEEEWIRLLEGNNQEFLEISKSFLSQNDILKIQFQNSHNSAPCGEKNVLNCTAYSSELGNVYTDGKEVNPGSSYVEFMKKFNFLFLEKVDYPVLHVQIASGEFGLCGLKYFPAEQKLVKNADIYVVKRIDDHWYYFCQDWN